MIRIYMWGDKRMLKVFSFIFISVAGYFFQFEAYAQPQISDEPAVFVGRITKESVSEFMKKHDKRDLHGIVMFSPGGDVEAGIELGTWVKARGLDVTVRTLCMSSCANYVFVAGKRKIVEPGALVIWHGSMEEKWVRDFQETYEALSRHPEKSQSETVFLLENKIKYEVTLRLRRRQAEFYSSMGIDERVTRLSQEPRKHVVDCAVASNKLMSRFGISDVDTPQNYGTNRYLIQNGLGQLLCKGVPVSFDLIDQRVTNSVNEEAFTL